MTVESGPDVNEIKFTSTQKTKTLEKFVEENDKNGFRLDWTRKNSERVFEKF